MEGWFVTVLRTDQIWSGKVLDTRAEVVGLSAEAVWQQRQVAEQHSSSTQRGLPGADKSTSAVDSTAK